MTTLAITLTEPVFVVCDRCCGSGTVAGADTDYMCCECDAAGEFPVNLDWLATLAHNLAIAGGLCAAYWRGWNIGWKGSAASVGLGDDDDTARVESGGAG